MIARCDLVCQTTGTDWRPFGQKKLQRRPVGAFGGQTSSPFDERVWRREQFGLAANWPNWRSVNETANFHEKKISQPSGARINLLCNLGKRTQHRLSLAQTVSSAQQTTFGDTLAQGASSSFSPPNTIANQSHASPFFFPPLVWLLFI